MLGKMKMNKEEYIDFMCTPNNEGNCQNCPENYGYDNESGRPCGQFHCLVTMHCKERDSND